MEIETRPNEPRSDRSENSAPQEDSTYLKQIDRKEQQANKAMMLARDQDLIFVSPILPGFALREKLWRKMHSRH